MQQQNDSLVLKLKSGDDIRRVRLENPAHVSFEDLQSLIAELYADLDLGSIVLKYEDEEGDKLSVTSLPEWKEAVRPFLTKERIGTLTLTLTPRTKPVAGKVDQTEESESEDDLESFSDLIINALKALGIDAEIKIEHSEPEEEQERQELPVPPFGFPPRFGWFGFPPSPQHFGFPPHPGRPHPFTPTEGVPQQPPFCPRRGPCGRDPRRGFFHPPSPVPPCPAAAGPHCFRRPFPQPPQHAQHPQQPQRRGCCQRERVSVAEDSGICTFNQTGRRYAAHSNWYNCLTCGLVGQEGCCTACAKVCHKDHTLIPRGSTVGFFCDCGAGARGLQCRATADASSNNNSESPLLPQTLSEEFLMKMKVGDLKAVLESRDVSYADCVDKLHLVEKILATSPSTTTVEEAPAAADEAEASVPEVFEVQVVETTEAKEEVEQEKGAEEGATSETHEEEEGGDEPQGSAVQALMQKLQFLQSMGFENHDRNVEALLNHAGDVNGAVAELLNEMYN